MKATWSTPMLHSQDINRSIHFYGLLGFDLIDVEGPPAHPWWARMHCEGGGIMFLGAEDDHPVEPLKQGFMLFLYTPDLPALCAHLTANGLTVPAISYPDYMPSGQIMLHDPDGYFVTLNHWSKKEQDAWERGLAEKRAAGRIP